MPLLIGIKNTINMISENNTRIAIIGLGYVGLPLAVEFGKFYKTIGYDINKDRITELLGGFDSTKEVNSHDIKKSTKLSYVSHIEKIRNCNIFIITVPTPIDDLNVPNLKPLISATEEVGKIIKKNDIVIYESTVYPGATEEVCVPILENKSNLIFNKDFFCGYSPERINPGDKKHRIASIKKVTSGSTVEVANKVDELYKKIIIAGTHKANSIKVAETAKVIENTQRDLNIALINELAIICNKLNIDTEEVLEAAETKWNFLSFRPGLVGGHCIGVDPYYLSHKAISIGYTPEIILAGRKINNSMGEYIVKQIKQLMHEKTITFTNINVLIMGLTFKENCPDIRNTRVVDLINKFLEVSFNVEVFDPLVNHNKAFLDYGISPIIRPTKGKYDVIVLAVAHDEFKKMSVSDIKAFGKKKHVLYDVKYLLNSKDVDGRL